MKTSKICVGYGIADVTPFAPVHLGSYSNGMERLSEKVKENDTFKAWALALTDEAGKTVILAVTDLSWCTKAWADRIRKLLFEKYQIPGDHIVVGGTHNHNGPDWYSEALYTPANQAYFAHWMDGVLDAVDQALADRKPAEFMIGRSKTEGLNFVRRYWREDGNLIGDVDKFYPKSDSPIVSHESAADEEIQMVQILRDGEPDILLCQWQGHGQLTGCTKVACTDWIGPMRRKMEREAGVRFFYMQGCAGNLNCRSRIRSENRFEKSPDLPDLVGEAVAEHMLQAYRDETTFSAIQTGNIQLCQQAFSAIAANHEPWTGELNAFSFGDLSVVTFPVEMFDTTGKFIKANTPFPMTLLMGYTCGIPGHGYCADTFACLHGGYEATSRGIPGTADMLAETYLNTLKQMRKEGSV